MSHFKTFLLISLVLGSCNRTYNVTTDSMSNTFNTGQVIKLKNKAPINRGDVVLFRRDFNSGQGKETWLFRVVAFSGDTVEMKDGDLFVNDINVELPENARLLYSITASNSLDVKSFRENMVSPVAENKYIAYLTIDEYANISKWPNVATISRIISSPGNHAKGIVRDNFNDNWNTDQFGPLYIPSSGEKININKVNRDLYADVLRDLQPDSTVTIKEKLYFLLGDNRSNASDSRFIGLVTESKIIGTVEEKP